MSDDRGHHHDRLHRHHRTLNATLFLRYLKTSESLDTPNLNTGIRTHIFVL